jgi:protein-disulfide isomerase
MSLGHRRLYFFLAAVVGVSVVIAIREITRTLDISTTKARVPLVSVGTYAVPLLGTEPTLGNPGAENTIILFADLGSPESKKTFGTIKEFVEKNPEKFKFVWKDAPEPTIFTKNAFRAHVAALCAERQEKFWPFAERVFSSRSNLSDKNLTTIAKELSLAMPEWSGCFSATSTTDEVQKNLDSYRAGGILEVPVVFINGKKIALVKEIKLEDVLTSLIK